MIKYYIYIISFLIAFPVLSQQLDSKISESVIYIGQPVTVNYSVKTKLSDSLLFIPKKELIKARTISNSGALSSEGTDFEITIDFSDTNIINGSEKKWSGKYTVTAWDSGTYILPGSNILINDSSFQFDDLAVKVLLMEPIDDVDLYDIKENFSNIPPKPFSTKEFIKTNWWWITLIVLSILILFYIKKKKQPKPAPTSKPASLKQSTLLAIESLEKAKLWEKNQLKEHFIELSMILRMYLTSRYELSLMEKTTYETKLLLTQKGLNKETVDVIAQILSESDMVKFAKSEPDTVSILRVSTLAKQIVAETSPLEFENV